ncbi:Mur ligase family protein [Ideonella sp.]|uniref:Mur ligase family protein n=1 Tax=Ideonella sp. TaxID=1929293 RepID=UPI002B4713A4|nr:Mur ligase family protein [Ideonella sp.]HJV69165.1 Mur ligase family protein [Ideonella sp.]
MKHLSDLSVLILGLGDSGLAMARWCARHGARVRVWDSRETPPQAAALALAVPEATLMTGALPADRLEGTGDLAGVKLILKSPGLAPADERIAPLLAAARTRGLAVQGELDLFAHALADLKAERGYAPKVLAITGTNGKTTTTSLTAMLVERTGARVATAGNIGPTMLDTLAAALDLEPAPAAAPPAPAAGMVDAERTMPLPHLAVADDRDGPVTLPGAFVDARPLADRTVPMPLDATGHSPDSVDVPVDVTGVADKVDVAIDVSGAGDRVDVAVDVTGAGDRVDLNVELDLASASIELPLDAKVPDGDEAPLQLAPPPPAAPVFEHLPEVWVLELSSFQLDGVQGFEPSAATVLNVTQDHLDWHGDMAAYAAAKARIFGRTALMVINRDDALVEAMVPAPVMVKGARGKAAKAVTRPVLRFGLDAPQRPGDFGLVTEGGMAWLVRALPADETVKRKPRPPGRRAAASAPQGGVEDLGRPGVFEDEDEEIHLQRLMPADALRIRGRHNAANALAALALATAIGCPLAPMLHGLREYHGEPHRVESIGIVGGIEAVDDSKGTNVGATVAALNGLGADRLSSKLVVVLGGDGKGQDFAPLAAPVARHARAVATIGKDAQGIEAALAATGVPLQRHATLEDAVRWCFAQAQSGDAVLLSPACASLDMFRNYAHRAEVFAATVRDIASERGEVLE